MKYVDDVVTIIGIILLIILPIIILYEKENCPTYISSSGIEFKSGYNGYECTGGVMYSISSRSADQAMYNPDGTIVTCKIKGN